MKFISIIFGRIWAVWGLIVFAITCSIVYIPIMLTKLVAEPKGTAIFRAISKVWMRIYLTLIGCRLVIKGQDNFKKGKTYVVVCNHNSFMDVPLTTPFIPGANRTIAKKSISKVPIFGPIYTRGSVLVDRNSDDSRRRSFELMKQTLTQGLHMVIYPEGTRNRTNNPLNPFYDGAFKLAIESNKEIIPTLLFNTRKVLPADKGFYLKPHQLEMHFLSAIPTEGRTIKEVKDQVYRIMWEYYNLARKR